MKYIRTIAIMILLFGLPAGSWYFLNSGLDWRKAKRETLKQKVRFITSHNFTSADKDKLFEIGVKKTNVVKLNSDVSELDEELIRQFKNSHTFQFLVMADGAQKPAGLSSKEVKKYFDPEQQEVTHDYLKGADYLLVDTSGYIRQYYTGTDKTTLNFLVEDIALILPKAMTRDILMKRRGEENE